MTLRHALGGQVDHVHDRVNQLLDREDGLIVLVDRDRAISYAAGFGLSACQLELVTVEIERSLRAVAGTASTCSPPAQPAVEDAERGDRGCRPVRGSGQGAGATMKGAERDSSDSSDGPRGLAVGAVLRLAATAAQPRAR